MMARLVAVSGPLKGTSFRLLAAETVIGRDKANDISIDDRAVSRRHCVIARSGDDFRLIDAGGVNRTHANNLPVSERLLRHGDEIHMGYNLFRFLLGEEAVDPVTGEGLQVVEGQVGGSDTTVLVRNSDGTYLRPDAVPSSPQELGRMARDLNTLLRIAEAMPSLRGLADLERRLLELIFEAIPAEHGAIVLTDGLLDEFASVFHWTRPAAPDRTMRLSRTVVERVLRERVALLCGDVDTPEFEPSESMVEGQIKSVLAVPLVALERLIGAVCLDTSNLRNAFDGDHLQLLTGIAGVAASALDSARRVEHLENENQRLREEIDLDHDMVGESPRMRQIYETIAKVAPTGSTVLIRGESGTGKELAARAIHRNSPRTSKPFVAINCAALTESLLESELFGHEKGAFTGAIVQKKGKLEEANGGSVFLDEVGEMPPALQAKLLRVLQEREFERVGGTRAIKTDIRLIAATNRDLEEAVEGGGFRRDLYYRLNVVSLRMPALRERREDIASLAQHFVRKHCNSLKRQPIPIASEALACLTAYEWPGNVRELENSIERAVVLASADRLLPEDFPESVVDSAPAAGVAAGHFQEAVKEAKRQIILKALEQSSGNYTAAAQRLGLHPNNLHRLIRTLDLKSLLKGSGG